MSAPNPEFPGAKYADRYRKCGIAQIVFGIISIVGEMGFVIYILAALGASTGGVYMGMWAGALYCVAGVLGIHAGKGPTRRLVIAGMVVSIVSCILAFVIMCTGISAMIGLTLNVLPLIMIFRLIVAIAGLGEFITSIVFSAFCCGAVCCGKKDYAAVPANTVVLTTVPANQPIVGYQPQTGYPPQSQKPEGEIPPEYKLAS
uniref:uncharacterized protein LOC100183563 isoform X2 n=1 Tax=Ciona intestinalis TaxID=7719 RepID=UPI000EF519AF|nr:uncharacterized protein LOC100183563 isoform X2 [Ciona intestinalis]|eukprot:XP_026694127.1 uncharacterized protein LOC100183563 isoform X2 [Ciona intestinalis]